MYRTKNVPRGGRPSKRHVWETYGVSVDHCKRCGCMYSYKAMGTAAIHCFPTPQWLLAHPEDNDNEN